MILCVAPSPAIDVTYDVAELAVGGTNRVTRVSERPGGKAVNVARVLTTLGEPVVVLAPVAGAAGALFRAGLDALGVPAELVDAGYPTRRTLTIVDHATGAATLLSEPARVADWAPVADRFVALLPSADVVVISGSLPAGAPVSAIADLVRAAQRPVIVDTSGPALAEAVAAWPAMVKPNADELTALTGVDDPAAALDALVATVPITVVASLGAAGLIAARQGGTWRARPAVALRGNPTGAGDALVAGLARGLASRRALPDMLAESVALSAAAVLAPCAGEVDPVEVDRQRAGVSIEEVGR